MAVRRKNILLSLLLLHAYLATPAEAADTRGRGRTMADTMFNMMDAMGQFSRDYVDSRNRSRDSFPRAWESMAPSSSVTTEPKRPTVSGPIRESERPSGASPTTTAETRLEGEWLGRGGERLTIRGSLFRLDAGPDRLLDGLLQLRGRLLAMHSPRHRQTWIYEYAENEDRLALRNSRGRLLLYRRVDPRDAGPPEQSR